MGSTENFEDCKNGSLDNLLEKSTSLRVVVGVACILSAIGSSMIILSYLCHKEHRTRARYILVHLSISNIGQVICNFVGAVANFDGSFKKSNNFSYDVYATNRSTQEQLCTAQAFLTVYFSVCGMLWIISLAVYLYLVILSMKQSYFTRYFVWLSYLVCYGLPLLVSVWLLLSMRLGYAPYSTPGYCGLATRKPFQKHRPGHHHARCDPETDVFGEFLGYDIWIFLTITLTLLFYMSALCYLKHQHKEHISDSANFWKTVQIIDYKFIAIPLTFVLLRIWSLVMYVLFTYIGIDVDKTRKIIHPMFFLMGIGNCVQGLVDAVLFVAFTPSIRNNIINVIINIFLCGRRKVTADDRFFKESKNYYDNNLKNYGPRYSLSTSSPVNVTSPRISASPEPSTSFYDDSSPGSSYHGIQNDHAHNYEYY